MIDAVLCMTVLAAVLFGWFLMKRLDRFLDENQKRISQEETQHPEPPCVVLEERRPVKRWRSSGASSVKAMRE